MLFRRTKAVKHGQDDAIYRIYSESKKLMTGKIRRMSMEDLFRTNAHDKTDMIVRLVQISASNTRKHENIPN